ncbi:GNAT family N-acetyltransferase [Anaerosporobacter faecicola]|uniref:GNAT family N-acetyltransferase n=1 Tax=Anaerosporobacter faecicola TaxID=2718714 RepID=UPI0014389997|nr:GNAT family N-acetyltransferase [Anaerosporobacter faecicola]
MEYTGKDKIRFATVDDAAAILAVYAPYIRQTTITYEYEVPTVEEFRTRMQEILSFFPYLVYEEEGRIVGYAYASKHHERAAFMWGAEISIYVEGTHHGNGIAGLLYDQMMEYLYKQGIYKVYALIDSPNEKSEQFHKKRGFQEIGCLPKTAYKLGKWCDLKYYEKDLRSCKGKPQELRSIHELLGN